MTVAEAIPETETRQSKEQLESLILGALGVEGCACASYLAGVIGQGKRAKDLIEPLESLVRSGVLRHKKPDAGDDRKYTKDQIVYELAS